jgi:DNA-binding transcriptional ArsR family regulator
MADIFSVIADPTRRELLHLLLDRQTAAAPDVEAHGDISVGEMVTSLGLSQPTVSKHLRVLRESGLVRVREEGQHRYYSLDKAPLGDVALWVEPFLEAKAEAEAAPAVPKAAPKLAVAPRTSPVPVPATLRRAAENLPDAGDVGTSLGRAVAQAQSRILDPVKKRLAHRDSD